MSGLRFTCSIHEEASSKALFEAWFCVGWRLEGKLGFLCQAFARAIVIFLDLSLLPRHLLHLMRNFNSNFMKTLLAQPHEVGSGMMRLGRK